MKDPVPDGYRLLENGEKLTVGDMVYWPNRWQEMNPTYAGKTVGLDSSCIGISWATKHIPFLGRVLGTSEINALLEKTVISFDKELTQEAAKLGFFGVNLKFFTTTQDRGTVTIMVQPKWQA